MNRLILGKVSWVALFVALVLVAETAQAGVPIRLPDPDNALFAAIVVACGAFLSLLTGQMPIPFFGVIILICGGFVVASNRGWNQLWAWVMNFGEFFLWWVALPAFGVLLIIGLFRLATGRDGYSRTPYVSPRPVPRPRPIPPMSYQPPIPAPTISPGPISQVLYHGTPTVENARSICQGTGTWVVGTGNVYGTGVYLANRSTASGYAGHAGAIVEVYLSALGSQVVDYNQVTGSREFNSWRIRNSNGNQGDALAAYVTEVVGKRFLKAPGGIFVVLMNPVYRNNLISFEGLTVRGAYDLRGNRIC